MCGAAFSNLSAAQVSGDASSSSNLGRGGASRKGDAFVSAGSDETPADGPDHPADGPDQPEGIPEIRPWREVGWIFKDGDALAIERQGDLTRGRTARISHLHDERE
jgi:hypothetical protein